MAACVKNFKNLTFTLAKRHQLKLSYELHSFQLYEGMSTAQNRPVDWGMLPECAKQMLPTTVHEIQHATLDQRKYRCGSVLVSHDGESPEFCEIQSLLVAISELYILTSTLLIDHFDRHGFCYCVKRSQGKQLHRATAEKFEYCLLDLYKNEFIVPKWEVW